MRLLTVSPPAAEPLTLDEAKAVVRQDFSIEDGLLSSIISSARARVETFTRRRLISQQVQLRLDGLPASITIPCDPVISLGAVTYLDPDGVTQEMPDIGLRLVESSLPARLVWDRNSSLPNIMAGQDTVRINLTVGYGTDATSVPADLLAAMRLLVAHYFVNRSAVIDGGATELPLGVQDLLLPHVVWV